MRWSKNIIISVMGVVIILLVVVLVFGYNGKTFFANNDSSLDEGKGVIDENTDDLIVSNDYENYVENGVDGENSYVVSYNFTKNDNYVSDVSVDDTYFIKQIYDDENYFSILLVNEGKLYYALNLSLDNFYGVNGGEIVKDCLTQYTNFGSNVKRIVSYNPTTGTDKCALIILNDGSVYSALCSSLDLESDFSVKESGSLFDDYNIDDVLFYRAASSSAGNQYKVILRDGTILEKTITYN